MPDSARSNSRLPITGESLEDRLEDGLWMVLSLSSDGTQQCVTLARSPISPSRQKPSGPWCSVPHCGCVTDRRFWPLIWRIHGIPDGFQVAIRVEIQVAIHVGIQVETHLGSPSDTSSHTPHPCNCKMIRSIPRIATLIFPLSISGACMLF